jgi:hypothetical protein
VDGLVQRLVPPQTQPYVPSVVGDFVRLFRDRCGTILEHSILISSNVLIGCGRSLSFDLKEPEHVYRLGCPHVALPNLIQAGVGISYFVTERSAVAKLLQTEQPEPLMPAPAYAPHLFSCESSTGG